MNLFLWGDETSVLRDAHRGHPISSGALCLDMGAMESSYLASWNKHDIKYFCKVKFSTENSIFQD